MPSVLHQTVASLCDFYLCQCNFYPSADGVVAMTTPFLEQGLAGTLGT